MESRDFIMWLTGYLSVIDEIVMNEILMKTMIHRIKEELNKVEIADDTTNLILDSPPIPKNPIKPYEPQKDFPGRPPHIYMGDKDLNSEDDE